MFEELSIKTTNKTDLYDISSDIINLVEQSQIKNGILVINIPHTTAAVTINENADSDVKNDMIKEINQIVPFEDNYHHIEGNSAAHIKSSMIGSSETIIIKDGRLLLGNWQGIYFCEFDGPRQRKIHVKIIDE